MNAQLIAPCGLDCSVCSRFLAFENALPKGRGHVPHCIGCRPGNKGCAFLKGNCELLRNNEVQFCFECSKYPCDRLRHLDERYREKFGMSPIANLEEIRTHGTQAFIRNQQRRFGCRMCGGVISVHDNKCYGCGQIRRGTSGLA